MPDFKKYVVQQGDTLYSLAQRHLGDATLAMDIAVLNDLDYPFIVEIGEERKGVVAPGDTIYLPLQIESIDVIDGIEENDAFGIDLAISTDKHNLSFVSGGDFSVNPYGDLATTQGKNTLIQDISHRLSTEYGTLPLHPNYGSYLTQYIGGKQHYGWEQKILVEVERAIKTDPRVEDVTNVSFSTTPNGIFVNCTIVTPLGLVDFSENIEGV